MLKIEHLGLDDFHQPEERKAYEVEKNDLKKRQIDREENRYDCKNKKSFVVNRCQQTLG